MTQDTAPLDSGAPQGALDSAPANDGKTPISSLPPDIQDYIRDLRKEAEAANKAKKAAETQRQREEAQRLEAANEWKTLAEQRAQALAQLEPKAQELDAFRQDYVDLVARRISELPKNWQGAVPEYDDPRKTMKWLNDNAHLFRAQTPVDIGAGVQNGAAGGAGAQKKKIPMSAEFAATASKMRMTPEQAQRAWDAEHNR